MQTQGKIQYWEPANTPFEGDLIPSMQKVASLPFVEKISLMPDSHVGIGCAVGSVIATEKAVIPSSVGVDIGCGMCAIHTSLKATDLPDDLSTIRHSLERTVPMGFNSHKHLPSSVETVFAALDPGLKAIHESTNGKIDPRNAVNQLGTLGGGNHFIELCLDENNEVWLMLHSGSRGIGNRIGQYYISKAFEYISNLGITVGKDYAWLPDDSKLYNDYVIAVNWAQDYAAKNRTVMVDRIIADLKQSKQLPKFTTVGSTVSCHHNYISYENHYGKDLTITRKGAISAKKGELGIIPGSMGTKSYIVEGLGNLDSMTSASHGAGRRMSRSKAKTSFTLADLREQTKGVECRKDHGVIDEAPLAYKNLDEVMAAQTDLVRPIHTLKAVLCCKG